MQSEHQPYFDALSKHPRLLVGQTVPAIGKEGQEVLRDEQDVASWKEAVKSELVKEVRGRAERQLEDNKDFLTTVHSSIELFQNNPDLIPGTKDFDVPLANRMADFLKPYELRVDGKLQGYSVPTQPIIDKLRSEITAQRAAGSVPAKRPATNADQARDDKQRFTAADQPQPGLQSKAGQSGNEGEDMSTFWGTIGLPHMRL